MTIKGKFAEDKSAVLLYQNKDLEITNGGSVLRTIAGSMATVTDKGAMARGFGITHAGGSLAHGDEWNAPHATMDADFVQNSRYGAKTVGRFEVYGDNRNSVHGSFGAVRQPAARKR